MSLAERYKNTDGLMYGAIENKLDTLLFKANTRIFCDKSERRRVLLSLIPFLSNSDLKIISYALKLKMQKLLVWNYGQ